MRVVGIKVLRNKLSEYIRAAASGETILVTDRDRVVAEISAPSKMRSRMASDARWHELIRRGVVTPALDRRAPLPPRMPVMTFDELMRDVETDRKDR